MVNLCESLEDGDESPVLALGGLDINDVVVEVVLTRIRSDGEEFRARSVHKDGSQPPDLGTDLNWHGSQDSSARLGWGSRPLAHDDMPVAGIEAGRALQARLAATDCAGYLVKEFTSYPPTVKRIADSTVRRLSLYLRFLEEFEQGGQLTVSSDELARRGGTTSAQVRKDLSSFGSFGKRGLGYSVHELSTSLRSILGLEREWKVVIIGAGNIGTALAQYRGFQQRGFRVVAVYDNDPARVQQRWRGVVVRDVANLHDDAAVDMPDIAVLTVPADDAQSAVDDVVAAGIQAVLNFAPVSLQVPPDVTVRTVSMAMELEGLSFALTNRE